MAIGAELTRASAVLLAFKGRPALPGARGQALLGDPAPARTAVQPAVPPTDALVEADVMAAVAEAMERV
jgi:hypothetical protein